MVRMVPPPLPDLNNVWGLWETRPVLDWKPEEGEKRETGTISRDCGGGTSSGQGILLDSHPLYKGVLPIRLLSNYLTPIEVVEQNVPPNLDWMPELLSFHGSYPAYRIWNRRRVISIIRQAVFAVLQRIFYASKNLIWVTRYWTKVLYLITNLDNGCHSSVWKLLLMLWALQTWDKADLQYVQKKTLYHRQLLSD